MKLSRNQIKDWCGDAVFLDAERSVRKGLVLRSQINGNEISGVFAHSPNNVNCSFTVLPSGMVESNCPCFINRTKGQICVHVAAIALHALARQEDPVRAQHSIEEERHAKRMEETISVTIPRSPRGIKAQFLIEIPKDFVTQFHQGKVTIRSIVLVNNKPTLIENLSKATPLSFSPEDDTLIEVLEDISEGGLKSVLTVNKIDFLGILDVCRGKTIYLLGGGRLSVNKTAVQFSITVELDKDNGDICLSPTAILPTGEEREGKFLAELEKTFYLSGETIYPLRPPLPLQYHGLYQEPITIPRSGVIPFISQEYPLLARRIPVKFQDGLNEDCWTLKYGTPRFILVISGAPDTAFATLTAAYGNKEVPCGAPEKLGEIAVPDPDDLCSFYGRNIPVEHAALSKISQFGFFGSSGDSLSPVKGERMVLNVLGGLIPKVRRLGWSVNVIGKLGKIYDSMAMAIPIVKIKPSKRHHGHFQVQITFEDGNGKKLPQPPLQQAINRGDSYTSHNGGVMLIDSNAINSMREIFIDCASTPGDEPGSFELSEVYAPYIDASLNALDGIDVERPEEWRTQADKANRTATLEQIPLGDLDNVLRPYQKVGVYWMRFMEKCGFSGILADEMGLGKTLQTLTWLSLERVHAPTRKAPALIVAPTSLVENWYREAQKFTPHLHCIVMQGASRHDSWDKIPNADIVITSYALLRRDIEHYCDITFSAAVLDEAQHIKNRQTQNSLAAKSLHAQSRLVLTGTPVENGVSDLWSIMDFLMPSYLGEYEEFKYMTELPILEGSTAGEEAGLRLNKKLRPFLLRRLKKDVAKDLPDKIQKISYSTLAPEQRKIYETTLARFREKINSMVAEKGFNRCRMDILSLLMRLRQICCHLALLPKELLGTEPDPEAPSGKLDQFMDILDEAIGGGHKILVFSQFVGMLQILKKALVKRGINYCYLDGTTKNRLDECKRFNQDPGIPVFLISLKAGGTGLNLTGADMVVHFDPWWNPAVEDQATDRAHRIGQKKTVNAIKLIAEDTVEEKVLALQRKKQKIINATVESTDGSIIQNLTWEDVKELFD